MANSIKIPRAHLIMGVCLPLAGLLGYLLASPLESTTIAVVVLVLSVLSVPLLMNWHHVLMVLTWNACITPSFFPGRMDLWVAMAILGLFFAMLNRSVNPERKFIQINSLTASLAFLLLVVFGTAVMTGGIGMRSLGSSQYGGRRYAYILAAVAGYFVLTSQRIPQKRIGLYLAFFFLPGLAGLVGNFAYKAGPSFYFLFNIFPAGVAYEQAMEDYSMDPTIARMGGLTLAAPAVYGYMLVRYGVRGVLDLSKPWRFLVFLLAAVGAMASGFRTTFIMFGLVTAFAFYLEGLHRTRVLPILLGLGLLVGAVVLPQAHRLPLSIQRSLSFLPANINPMVAVATSGSTEWRLQIWRELLPEIPKYLWQGKGYGLSADELGAAQAGLGKRTDPHAGAKVTGDYHNGPLSILIPLGIFGLGAFIWFLTAAVRTMYHYHRFGDSSLRTVNTVLLALFLAKIVLFFCVFGSLYSDLAAFTGLIGVSVSLNGPINQPEAKEQEAAPELVFEDYSRRRQYD